MKTADPVKLVTHAAQEGDWRLVELIARSESAAPKMSSAPRAYLALVRLLGLQEPE